MSRRRRRFLASALAAPLALLPGGSAAVAASPGAAPPPAAGTAPAPAPAPSPAPARPSRGATVAKVNGAPIYQADLETAIATFARENRLPDPLPEEKRSEVRRSILDGLIGTELLFQRAGALGIDVAQPELEAALQRTRDAMGPDAVRQEMERRGMTEAELTALVRQNLVVQRMIKQVVIDPLVVPETEIRQYYTEHPDQMQRPAGMAASHILVRWTEADGPGKREAARKRIEEALARSRKGEDFALLAKEYSQDGSAESGGQLGMIYPGQTVPPFEEAALKLAEGEVSGVVETPFGFHLIKAGARQPEGLAPFDDVRGPLGDYLKQRHSQEAIEKLVGELRAAAKVEIL